jgi:hypothetical protein
MEAFDVWIHNDRILNGRAAEGNKSVSSIQCPTASAIIIAHLSAWLIIRLRTYQMNQALS